ncbi:MAG TPA: formyltransferase family protein [Vicinamibacteria bacterium]|nr:formyltransferase family protein [Vicinamibacteria bacterium]
MTRRPRVVMFGSGSPISTEALSALARETDVVGVVVPAGPRIRGPFSAVRAWRRRRSTQVLRTLAGEAVTLSFDRHQPGRGADAVRALRPDLVCVATFPWLLPSAVLEAAPLGAIGVHPSALPRHRGPAPLFWTYHDDDAEAGVSVFRIDEGVDAGAVLGAESFALERGRLGSDLYAEIARRGAALLVRAALETVSGRAAPVPQDEAHATREPLPRPGRFRIDFDTWGAERVWHFLRGVGEAGRILDASNGRAPGGRDVPDRRMLTHGPARTFVRSAPRSFPGRIERIDDGLLVHCHDGWVEVAARPSR